MEKKQTAIHWLAQQVFENENDIKYPLSYLMLQALEIEKKNIIDSYYYGNLKYSKKKWIKKLFDAEQYYKTKYQK
jgi:GTP-dependent phosphoenolpyruvate carboxykinase